MKDETEKHIRQAFGKIDKGADVPVPSVRAISMLVQEKHAAHKKSVFRELRLFLLAAIAITALLLVILTNNPVIFVMIQVTGLAVMLMYVAVQAKLRKREETQL